MLRTVMKDLGATMAKNGASSTRVSALQETATRMGRVLRLKDAKVAVHAINNRATLLTLDINFTIL